MSTATTAAPKIAPPPTVKRGFSGLPCPNCGELDGIHVVLSDVSAMRCVECENELTTDDVRNFIAKWSPVLSWLETCPVITE